MATLTRTYSFTDGTVAYGSQVDAEIANIVNHLNSLDQGNTAWTTVKLDEIIPTQDLDFSSYRLANIGAPTTAGDAARYPITAAQITSGTITPTQIATTTKVHAYLSTSTGTINTATNLVFDTEVFDTLTEYNAGTGAFVPGVTGYYQINVNVDFQPSSGSSGLTIELYNSTAAAVATRVVCTTDSGQDFAGTMCVLMQLTASSSYVIRINYSGGNSGVVRGGSSGDHQYKTNLSISRIL